MKISPSRWLLLSLLALWAQIPTALAHRIDHLSVTVNVAPSRDQGEVQFSTEVKRVLEAKEAMSLLPAVIRGGASRETVLPDVIERAREYFAENAQVLANGAPLPMGPLTIEVIEVDEKDAVAPDQADKAAEKKHLFAVGKWSGRFPNGTDQLTLYACGSSAAVFGKQIGGIPVGPVIPYFSGETSKPFLISEAATPTPKPPAEGETAPLPAAAEPPPPLGEMIGRYIKIGVDHILPPQQWWEWLKKAFGGHFTEIPDGLDHILFVLGLFLLSTRFKPLLWQVTAFTIAHSVTLGLAMANIVRLPDKPVEVAIAASIAFVAIENLFSQKLHFWRPIVVFIFGLIHGLGFAGAFREVGIPEGQFLPALLSFNVGVEVGQLAVIGIASLLVGWAWKKPWYRKAIAIPASCLIAIVGLYWTVERIMG